MLLRSQPPAPGSKPRDNVSSTSGRSVTPFLQEPSGALLSGGLARPPSRPLHRSPDPFTGFDPATTSRSPISEFPLSEAIGRLPRSEQQHRGSRSATSDRCRSQHRAESGEGRRSRLAGAQGAVVRVHAGVLRYDAGKPSTVTGRGSPAHGCRPTRSTAIRRSASPRHRHGDFRRRREPEHGLPLVPGGRVPDDDVQRAARLVDGQPPRRAQLAARVPAAACSICRTSCSA